MSVRILRYRYRGWDEPKLHPVQDARWALTQLYDQHPDASIVLLGHSMGGRAADAIDGLAASFRRRLDVIAEANALSAQARLSAVVVGAAPIGYLAFSAMVDPGSVAALVGTGVGRTCLVVGLGLEVLAAWWIRRILRSAG